MTDQSSAIVPAQPGGLTFGQTNLRANQFVPPRVKIVQLMSDEKATGRADAGDFYNTLTNENYGSTIKFLPIQPFMNRVLLVRDEKQANVEEALSGGKKGKEAFHFDPDRGGTLKCRSLDMIEGVGEPGIACDECPLSQWRAGNAPPLCTEVYNVFGVHELGDPIILQFQKSSAKAGKQLFSMLRFGGHAAPWTRFYSAETHDVTIANKGTFAVPVVTKTAEVPPTELIRDCQRWASELAGFGPIDVTPPDADDEDREEVPTGDEPF